MTPLVEFRNVTKDFGVTRALESFDLSVEPGSVYGMVGRNGAGKTTALRMLAGLESPTHGEIRLFGIPVDSLDNLSKARVAYAAAGQVLPPALTVSQVGVLVRRATPDWDETLFQAILKEGRVPLHKNVRALSRGLKQRLRLALAYAKRPKILILDEPTEGLDTVVRFDLFSRILDVVAGGDACTIVSSHFLGDIERVVDRIGFISGGHLMLEGQLDEFKERIRRVRVAWNKNSDPGSILDDYVATHRAFAFKRDGRQAVFLTECYDPEWLAAFNRRFPGCVVESDRLGLEDIFIELLRDQP